MVKLASARECRLYGPASIRSRCESINAGLYALAVLLVASGFSAQLPGRDKAGVGLLFILVGLTIMATVNGHDLVANVAGIDYRIGLVAYDLQLGFVEFAVPLVQILGCIVMFYGIYLMFIQEHKDYNYNVQEVSLKSVILGPLLWLLGSIGNACQIYEQLDAHLQVLQSSVYIPFIMGSLLFLVGGILNHFTFSMQQHDAKIVLVNTSWELFSIFGSICFLVGGLMNVLKVFKMQQPGGLRLEKFRGGAQQILTLDREVDVPILDESTSVGEARQTPTVAPRLPTIYYDM